MSRPQVCRCGSGLFPHAHHDARGIFLTYACSSCEAEKLAGYRPDVLTDANYWHDEALDDD